MIGRPSGLSSFYSKGRGEPFERTDVKINLREKTCKKKNQIKIFCDTNNRN
jgi:hypothetical protein